jgi:purine-binding chemotaxis protein CheW
MWEEAAVSETAGHLVFACGEALFALPPGTASEIVTLPELARVPGAPAHVLGVFPLRGELLPVIDLLLLLAQGAPGPWRRAVVLRAHGAVAALAVTRVLGVMPLAASTSPGGATGARAHLRAPVDAPPGPVRALEPKGLLEFLAHPA